MQYKCYALVQYIISFYYNCIYQIICRWWLITMNHQVFWNSAMYSFAELNVMSSGVLFNQQFKAQSNLVCCDVWQQEAANHLIWEARIGKYLAYFIV